MLKYLFFLLIVIGSTSIFSQADHTLYIEFEGLKVEKGKLFIALYDNEDDFLKKEFKGSIVEIKNGRAQGIFKQLNKGIYAISSFHDKNDNGKMDTNFLGIPKEPIACSNNAKGSFGPPKFKDAKFTIAEEETHININFK
jgi:uncharacterized protein (DUF2141 family)